MSQILLAEDDRISRVMLQAVLQKWGYKVVVATNGEEALERMLDPKGPQLAILDWMMPKFTGLEVCRTLRETVGLRLVHIILLTSKSRGADAAEALESGADDHLAKPYDLVELQARIKLGLRRISQGDVEPARLGSGQDDILQRILSRFLPMNRLAVERLAEDPGLFDLPHAVPGSCDLQKAVELATSTASRLLAGKVTLVAAGETVRVGLSAETMVQVFLNILCHFRLAASDQPISVKVGWRRDAGRVVLECIDDGPDVSPEDIPLLGWPVSSVRNRNQYPGVGLFFANLAVENAGGAVFCEPGPGKGLRILLRLPGA